MAYNPDDLIFDVWGSPKTINSYDLITDLDDAVNDIVQDDPNALVPFINGQFAKIPPYLTVELEKLNVEITNTSALSKAWAEGTEPEGPGTFSSKEYSEMAEVIYNNTVVEGTAQTARVTTEGNTQVARVITEGDKKIWKAEAEAKTADSYATEPHNVFVKLYTSNDDGTFSFTNSTDYSSLHWSTESDLAGVPTPAFPADEGLALVAKASGNEWDKILGLPVETNNQHKTVTTKGVEGDSFWSPFVTSPNDVTEDFTIATGASASIVSPTINDGITVTIPDGSTLAIL